ncbi:MAG: metalloprotease PmbA, partial [Gammaproteobacteria bacterium]|nr:metalloprotease PmbA [Gammaproteobacteria bacterium]
VNSEGAGVDSTLSLGVYGNSHGFLAARLKSRHSISCSVVAEHNGAMQRDYWYDSSRIASLMDDPKNIGQIAAQRTVKRLDAQKIKTQTAPVLFSPEMARGLFSNVFSAIGGTSQYRKASFLLDKLDQIILPTWLSINEDPFVLQGLNSASYDGEGVATKVNEIVTSGRLNTYLLSSYSARKLGRRTTGHAGGVRNISISRGEKDLTAMLKTLDNGLFVTELMGQGVNTITGDYSRGAAGFWVENGEIKYPVEEITIAGNLTDMLKGIVEIGADIDKRSSLHVGSLLIEKMMIAGND